MNIARNIVISQKILFAHRVRTALSLSGIIIGVCAVIIMVAIGRGTESRIIAQITKMGSNLLMVNAGQVKIIAGRARQTKSVTTLVPKDAPAILADSNLIDYAVPAQSKKLPVKYGNLSTRTTVMGTTADIVKVRNYSLRQGRFFDREADNGRRREAVLGETVVKNIFGRQDPVGETIRLGRVPFKVIGVLAPKGLDINGTDQDDLIIIPLKTALRRLFNVTYLNTIYIQAVNSKAMNRAEKEIRAALRAGHHLRAGRADDFTIRNQASVLKTRRASGQAFTLLISTIAAVSLLVGGIGVLAVMLISVRERIKEIGIRRAMGARKSDILLQFLAESLLLSISGGLIGIISGLIAAVIITILANLPFILPLKVILISLLSTVIMGVIFGVYPAGKAAAMNPIKCLQFK
ncbi:ABC transporter permease [Desulfobacterota bacterium M19]